MYVHCRLTLLGSLCIVVAVTVCDDALSLEPVEMVGPSTSTPDILSCSTLFIAPVPLGVELRWLSAVNCVWLLG